QGTRQTAFSTRAQQSRTFKATVAAASGQSTPPSSASPPGLPHRTRLHPRSSSTVSGKHHDAGAGLAATSALWPRPGPRFYAAPPYAAQRYTAANPQTLYAFARSENHHGFQTVANS
ncbi:MAG: hypothetical protein ACFNYN_03885, partial [Peptidiphaga gingivicola]